MMSEKILKDVVIPGEEIGVIEEFLPGEGTYVDGNSIRSMLFGTAILDVNERKVRIKPLLRRSPLIIERGDVVIGEVIGMKKDVATIVIRRVENKELNLSNPFHGLLHVSQVSDKFIEFLSDAVRVTDILRAKVINLKPPYQLSIKERGLGVILTFCPICQSPMSIKKRKLYCLKCKIQEKRKISTRYSINFKL
ncbi:MAG: exosome complex RNA-binding protein Csl4 [Candidatus Nezhaarchaeales archaeon]|nr:MAG: RNA-binding protein [Candidatus Nezhaarchaeota archaeon WYZ-LMO7]